LKIRFLLSARRELTEAVRYYNAQRERLGEQFRDEIWETIQRIQHFPEAWQPLSASIRRCQMNRFPYGLIYESSEEEIVIIAVGHLHRAPEYWRSRTDEI
jgi:hypothetical protein